MFGLFNKKVDKIEFNNFKQAVQTGFNSAKQDTQNLSKWIKHLNSVDSELKNHILELEDELTTVKDELENMKNIISILGDGSLFKQNKTMFNKQTDIYSVDNTDQTGVQTVLLKKLTTNERAIIYVLLNSDMKLSYEDLATMLGKRKSTIRGQVNSIRQKSEGLIEERVGENNKKRIFIPEKAKEILLKSKKAKNKEKGDKND